MMAMGPCIGARRIQPVIMKTFLALLIGLLLAVPLPAEPVLVGAARVEVTPTHPVVLAGYGGRRTELEGIDTPLWARAMAIGDTDPVAVVVLDNCGVPAAIKARLVHELAKDGITAERLVVAATHTHNAPNLVGYAQVLWAGRMNAEQEGRMEKYTEFAVAKMAEAVRAALKNRQPLHLEWSKGKTTFGGNRRIMIDGQWRGFGFQRDAPVDHSLPVLAAKDEKGEVKALWANYACHCTTVGSRNHVSGDWAGFANDAMERAFPSATALMTIGCGADVGPQPSGTLQHAQTHGEAIGAEVQRLLSGKMRALNAGPTVSGQEVALPLVEPKPRAHWESLKAKGGFDGQLGIAMLKKLDAGKMVPSHVNYPVASWRFGKDLAMVFLPGEVVVDYSVRLNRELDWTRLWVTAWSNDMPGYIPSKRVLAEGGYEADFSQVYYEQPGRYQPQVEDVVVKAVHAVVGAEFVAPDGQKAAPYHSLPSGVDATFSKLAKWAAEPKSVTEAPLFSALTRHAKIARPAITKMIRKNAEVTTWQNFAGDQVKRLFIRQDKLGRELAWVSDISDREKEKQLVFCFTGGTGWQSEPKTKGFALFMNGKEVLGFDVARILTRWGSQDGLVELFYLPTWSSHEDTGGFFFLVLAEKIVGERNELSFSVRSLGEGSKRWFAIEAGQSISENLIKLNAALTSIEP